MHGHQHVAVAQEIAGNIANHTEAKALKIMILALKFGSFFSICTPSIPAERHAVATARTAADCVPASAPDKQHAVLP